MLHASQLCEQWMQRHHTSHCMSLAAHYLGHIFEGGYSLDQQVEYKHTKEGELLKDERTLTKFRT